ncbi:MAG: DUF4169 family protein [Alphaproteobacteria bacterium]|nr:DUF4169 family protein [Alphaproteobacteria bacterium]
MGEVINLRQERKRRARAEQAGTASKNRAKFGLPTSKWDEQKREFERAARDLDGKRRDDRGGGSDSKD